MEDAIEKRLEKLDDNHDKLVVLTKKGFDEMTDEFIKVNGKLKHLETDSSRIKEERIALNSESAGLRSRQYGSEQDMIALNKEIECLKVELPNIAYKQDLAKLEKKLPAKQEKA